MSFYILPALIALSTNLFVVMIARRAGVRTGYLYSLIVTFAIHNVCELVLFSNHGQSNGMTVYILGAYYAITFALIAIAHSCALQVAEMSTTKRHKIVEKVVWATAFIGIVLSLFSSQIVAGAAELSYSSTAVKGQSYWLFQATAAIAIVDSIAALTQGIFSTAEKRQKIRCMFMLGAYIPMILSGLSVLFLMNAGFPLNATGVLPLACASFIIILVYGERRHRLTDIRRVVPGTRENKVTQELQTVFTTYASGDLPYQEATNKIESLLLEYSYDKHSGNVLQTAKFMQVGRSTLYKKMQKHKLGRQHQKQETTDEPSAKQAKR